MRRVTALFCAIVCMLFALAPALAASESDTLDSWYCESLGITVPVPAGAYITGSNVSEDFPLLDVYGMTAEQLEERYSAAGICMNAIWYDDDAEVTEIVVTTTKDSTTRAIFNLGLADDSEMHVLESKYLNYSGKAGAVFNAVTTVEHPQTRFIKAMGTVDGAAAHSNHLQYMTIVNGVKVEIALIEHFGVSQEFSPDSTPWNVSERHERLMAEIISGVHWKHIRTSFFARYPSLAFLCVAAAVCAVVLLVILTLQRKRGEPLTIYNLFGSKTPAGESPEDNETDADSSAEDIADSPSDDESSETAEANPDENKPDEVSADGENTDGADGTD